jgi:hypothetical protein
VRTAQEVHHAVDMESATFFVAIAMAAVEESEPVPAGLCMFPIIHRFQQHWMTTETDLLTKTKHTVNWGKYTRRPLISSNTM